MSSVIVNSTLILDGNLTTTGDVNITPSGLIVVVPDEDLMKTFFNPHTNTYTTSNGQGRIITTTIGNVIISGKIDGKGQGFGSDRGPGANSVLEDSDGNILKGYGATHAGLGYISVSNAPSPRKIYGNHETPVSLGSGSGLYHPFGDFFGTETKGGGAIKIVARSGIISVNGEIVMDGESSSNVGGASGGSIWLFGWALDGTGKITSEGGTTTFNNGGGGGGGYISMWYDRTNNFSGLLSVGGKSGAGDGKIFLKQTEPIFEERFTGNIWNKKWWNDPVNDVILNNFVQLKFPAGNFDSPSVTSLFNVSGKNITTTIDFIPTIPEISQYSVDFLLKADEQTWFGLSRRPTGIFGVSAYDGSYSASGIPEIYSNATFRLMKLDSTLLFQYYTPLSAPQTIYYDVRDELADKVFSVYLGVNKPSSPNRVRQFRLTPLDIANRYVQMDGTFSDVSSVTLDVLTGPNLIYGTDYSAVGNRICWDASNLGAILEVGEMMRTIYSSPVDTSYFESAFDSLKIFDGVIGNFETKEPVLYVDHDFGSDSSDGRQLSPLKNLFVATAWSKRGGTVVLYDGTHNSTSIIRKDLTIRGAEGAKPLISTSNVLDTTGSGWETNALSFYGCQGRIENIQIADSSVGIRIENTNLFEITRNLIHDVSTGVHIVNCDPVVMRNRIYNTDIAIDMTNSWNNTIYSNTIHDSTTGIHLGAAKNYTVVANTVDGCGMALLSDNSSNGVVTSNSMTNNNIGIQTDTTIMSHNNSYCGDTTNWIGPVISDFSDLIYEAPWYVNRYGNPAHKDYHLTNASSNIGAGNSLNDSYMIDMDGVARKDGTPSIGAYEYVSLAPHSGDYYVSGSFGDDHTNSGGINDPFRTLDKALLVADATIHIDGGHYDSYFIKLQNQGLFLGADFAIYSQQFNHILLYHTLNNDDVLNGFIKLPSIISIEDFTNVALNVIGSPAQLYGTDFIVKSSNFFEPPNLFWKGYAIEGLISTGDILRILFKGAAQHKFLNYVLHSHYSNLEKERAIFVSPSGSDNTVSGIPGTDTGGNGTLELPYRTIHKALMDSSQGDYIVAIAGEYPIFNGRDNRVIVPLIDRTNVPDGRKYYEDLFMPEDFRAYGTTQYDDIPWIFDYDGNSYANSGGGFLNFTYDGSNIASAVSEFQIVNNFEVLTTLRNAVDPLNFIVTNGDSSVYFIYDGSHYTAGVYTGGSSYWVDKYINSNEPYGKTVTEYIPITANDVRNKNVSLHFIPDPDTSNTSLNIVGGVAQNYGEDYYIQDSKIKWDGMNLDGDLQAGDILRILYDDNRLSRELRVSLSLVGTLFRIKVYDGGWNTVFLKNISSYYHGPWSIIFRMDSSNSIDHKDIYGKGFVSKFVAIGESFVNYESDELGVKTERKTITLY